ncbi:type II toxin-antitoxin system RelE family toxin [Methylomonas methanica]|uniref:Addiction module toxin, RelE/StbE family n=1 Tax=Methylomonas methanica (strain DSM 25384 / MC09) TaxID=857087 RepID=G0A736_METMM|nr:type II toxin-antitoxin system RelE/ParE family toxin [Methylomonas methanica]AEG01830.1 addiction module toxin, RelE/StbE family [Methylomonas methanica MC09]
MAYSIQIKPSAQKDLLKLPPQNQTRLLDAIQTLSVNPRPSGIKKLQEHELYRLRVGDYRIIYAIQDQELLILVATIGHRKDVYRR